MYRVIKQIVRFYSSQQQLTVYDGILEESASLRRQYRAYRYLNRIGFGYLVLALYGFRTAGRYDTRTVHKTPVLALCPMPRHKYNMEYIKQLSGYDLDIGYIKDNATRPERLKNMFILAHILFRKKALPSLWKSLRIIKHIDQRYGWVQAFNIASFIFGVFAFQKLFCESNKICFTANDFSPIPLAFKYAAKNAHLKQMFVMHGQISSAESGNTFPRLDYDVAFLYGQAALDAYTQSGEPKGQVLLTGFPGKSLPIRKIDGSIKTIGICLANYYDPDTYQAILQIGSIHPNARVYLRCHPRSAQNPDFSQNHNIEISRHADINELSAACDVVIAGNTGAQIDILKSGCPVVHYPALDKLGEDDIGLVADQIVPLYNCDKALDAQELNKYFAQNWVKKFKKYDEQYLADQEDFKKTGLKVKNAYRSLLAA